MSKNIFTKIILVAIFTGSSVFLNQCGSTSQSTKPRYSAVFKASSDSAKEFEEEAIRKVIESESAAITNLCDYEKWADHWWHEPYTFFSLTFPDYHVGLRGWNDIAAWGKQTAADCTPNKWIFPKYDYRYKISGAMAFATFLENEGNISTRVLEKRNGQWKLIRMGVVGTAVYKSLTQKQGMARDKMRLFDTPPRPISGFSAIQRNLVYPEEARELEIEGKVIIEVLINEDGMVEDTRVVESLRTDCDLAAVNAVKKTKWKPAEKEGKPLKVRFVFPVIFRIKP